MVWVGESLPDWWLVLWSPTLVVKGKGCCYIGDCWGSWKCTITSFIVTKSCLVENNDPDFSVASLNMQKKPGLANEWVKRIQLIALMK